MIKQFLKYLNSWETFAFFGVLALFVSNGWYAMMYEGDNETIKYSMIIVGIVGGLFIVASFFNWRKKKRNKQI